MGGLGLLAVLLAGSPMAFARPLDDTTCGQLDRERQTLEDAGVLIDLRLNQSGIKALAPERLKRTSRYVEVSAQVLFRCQSVLSATPLGDPPAAAPGVQPPVSGAAKTAATEAGKAKTAAPKKQP